MLLLDESDVDVLALVDHDFSGLTKNKLVSEALPAWLTFKSRQISHVRRRVVLSRRVQALEADYPAISKIKRRLKSGGDLSPYLHKKIYSKPSDESADLALLDWGLHHFHLGDDDGSRSVARTEDVLFAHIEGETAYLVDIKLHGKNNPAVWGDADLVRALIEVAPEIAERHRIKGVSGLPYSVQAAERAVLRSNGVNSIVEVDGNYYAALGYGISSAVTSIRSRRLADDFILQRTELRLRIERNEYQFPGVLRPPHAQKVAVLRCELRAGRLVILEESSQQVLLKSPVI